MQHSVAILVLGMLGGMGQASSEGSTTVIQLATVPEAVFKIRDPGRAGTESWYFNLVVADAQDRDEIRPLNAVVEVFARETLREKKVLPGSTLELMLQTSYRVTSETDELSLRRRFSLDEVFDFRLEFCSKPLTWEADRVRITLTLDVTDSKSVTKTLEVPLRVYSQRTRLIFPLRGPAIVSQGQINNSGHSGHANQFAIDVMGLNSQFGPMDYSKEGNAEFAGWGREIVAPADGKVVYARNDVPDNPPDVNPRRVYSKAREPLLAIAGNCIIIDHGSGEFSVLMHMQRGSVTAQVGTKVRQGQTIGRMGRSGDAFDVHLHYQLQDGPELFRANSLPVEFGNLKGIDLVRGAYIEAY